MTREEEDRRLALSAAIANMNKAIELVWTAVGKVGGVMSTVDRAVANIRLIVDVAQADLDALKKKAIDEEREATK